MGLKDGFFLSPSEFHSSSCHPQIPAKWHKWIIWSEKAQNTEKQTNTEILTRNYIQNNGVAGEESDEDEDEDELLERLECEPILPSPILDQQVSI